MIWLIVVLNNYLEEQLLIKYYTIKHLILLKNPKYDWYQRGLISVFFDKNSVVTRANKFATHIEKEINSEIQQLP